jgi:hypothetical protein
MVTLYRVVASTVETVEKGTIHRQTPTFIIQGVRDEEHAEQIAQLIINPTGNLAIQVNAYASKWIDV